MKLKSLGYRTDLGLLGFSGEILDRGDYLVARSPQSQDFFWGNLLVMPEAPKSGDLERWTSLFQREFSDLTEVKHMTFGWDSTTGELGASDEFVREGYDLEKSIVLSASLNDIVPPPRFNNDIAVRPLRTDNEWESAVLNQVACRREDFAEAPYIEFTRTRKKVQRAMSEAGYGNWYGAFLGDQLVGDCGLYVFEGIGRFQSVGTNPNFRRQGICGTLVYHVAKAAKENTDRLVMVADPEYHAARIYESVGFRPTEKQIGAYRWPKKEWTQIKNEKGVE